MQEVEEHAEEAAWDPPDADHGEDVGEVVHSIVLRGWLAGMITINDIYWGKKATELQF